MSTLVFTVLALFPACATALALLCMAMVLPLLWARAEAPYAPAHEHGTWASDLNAYLDHDPRAEAEALSSLAEAVEVAWTHLHWVKVGLYEHAIQRGKKAARSTMARGLPVKGRESRANTNAGFLGSNQGPCQLVSARNCS